MQNQQHHILVGGITPQDVNDPGVVEAAKFAEYEIQRSSNSLHRPQLTKILSAGTQVVSGINYVLSIEITTGSNTSIHDVKIYKPFNGNYQLTTHTIRN